MLAGALALFGGGTASATSPTVCTWTAAAATGGTAYWSTPGNWDCGTGTSNGPPAAGDAVVFPATVPSVSGALTPHLDESAPSSGALASITFDNSYTMDITSTSTTLSLDPSAAGVSGNVAIAVTTSSTSASIGTPGSPEGDISITGSATIESAGGLYLDAALSGGSSSDSLTFGASSYYGGVTLDEASTYSYPTTVVADGTLYNGVADALPSSTSLVVNGGYNLGGHSQTLAGLTGIGDVESTSGSPTLTIDSTAAGTFAGDLTGSLSLDSAGSGTLTLSGTNTYTGDTTVSGGTLVAASSSALGGTASTAGSGGAVTVDSGATLQVGSTNSSVTLPNDLVLESGSTLATPTLSSYSSATDFSVSGTTTLNGPVSVYAGHDTNLYLEGQVGGTGSITTTGPYTTWITDSSNDYSGGTTVADAGTLVVEASGALGTGPVTDEGNAPILLDGSSISLANDFTISGGSYCDGGIICDGFATFNPSVTAGADTLSGKVDLAGNAGLGTASGGILSVTGNISGSYGLTTNGDVVLSATNSYTGTTSIALGTLTVTNGSALGGDPSSAGSGGVVTVDSGATLQLASGSSNTSCLPSGMAAPSSFTLPNDLVVDGTGTNGAAGIDNCEGTNTISGEVSLASNTVPVDVNCTASLSACQTTESLTLSGPVSGSQGIELGNGAGGVNGMLVLTGTSGYTGTTSVTAGTLDVTGSIGSSAGVTLYGGSVLEGTGTVPAITTNSCSSTSSCTIYPGDAPGTLTSTGYANLSASGSTLQVDLASTSPGSYSQLVADGANVSGTVLDITAAASATYGTTYDILHNTSGSSVTGEFSYQGSPLSQGEVFSADGQDLQIAYDGSPTGGAGTGNDVVLTNVTNPPPQAPPAPTVASISPASGPPAGGTSVTITGSNLLNAASVDFGSVPARSFVVVSPTQIDAVSPAGSAGESVNVTVVTPGGTSATGSPDLFTYVTAIPPGFHPITPTRICDTRPGNPSGLSGSALSNCEGKAPGYGDVLTVQVAGLAGVPSDATAVDLNVTVVDPSSNGFLTLYPAGGTVPTTSSLNFQAGTIRSNMVFVGLSSSGQVAIYDHSSGTNLVVDVEGWVGPESTPGTGLYVPVTPARICDTRLGQPANPCSGDAPAAGGTMTFPVAGEGPVPSSGVAAVIATITAIDPYSGGYLSAYPAGGALPVVSQVSYAPGTITANSVVLPLGKDGQVSLYSSSGAPEIAVDVEGYITDSSNPSATGSVIVPAATPVRICDTRLGNPSELSGAALSNCEGKTLNAGATLSIQAAGIGGVPADATGVIVNITATDTTASSYLTAWPTGATRPDTSIFDWSAGETLAGGAVLPVGSNGQVSLYNYAGSADVIVDVVGWLVPVSE